MTSRKPPAHASWKQGLACVPGVPHSLSPAQGYRAAAGTEDARKRRHTPVHSLTRVARTIQIRNRGL
jgi:hypothetical protein